ncbi:cutinase family protein [Nocardia gamkensis]|uniref:Cutinase family protein n=1 Tax=Nocardia gamkensis TaxID=352869 RepID=A0A7X6L1Q3_9NOCA|nr:cutinase family protein [Nocardia gamkensis]NKY26247.1 cutinase family protein [Nocardia gamkensis]NQE72543.1 Chitinase [Nocardia gamkensis]
MHDNHTRIAHHAAHMALCAAITATTVTAGVAAAEPTSGRNAAQCPRWTALLVPGTYETTPIATGQTTPGVLTQLGESLTARYGSDIEVRTLAAPTTGAGAASGGELTAAVSELCSDTRAVLAGYGQGAEVTGDLATTIGNNKGLIPASRVVAVALVSDPRRDPATTQLGTPVSGQGVTGPRSQSFGELTDRVRTLCAKGDSYCSTTAQESPVLAAVGRALGTTTSIPATSTPAPTRTSTTTSATVPTATTTAPATTTSTGQLSASQVLAPVVTVLNGLASFTANVPAIVADLAQLPSLLATSDVPGLHRVSGDLNNQFNPLVQMAAGLDLRLVARALKLAAPLDSTGVATIAAEIVGVLAGLDITRIANDVGRAQEIAWTAAETLANGDPVAAFLALTGLAPIAADLLSATATAFTGTQFPTLTQTYNTATTAGAGTATGTGAAAPQNGDTAVFPATGYDTAAPVLTDWILQAIDRTK